MRAILGDRQYKEEKWKESRREVAVHQKKRRIVREVEIGCYGGTCSYKCKSKER